MQRLPLQVEEKTAAIVRTGTAANTTTAVLPNVISCRKGGTPQPVTMYGRTTSGGADEYNADSECGTTVVSMYSASTTTKSSLRFINT